ncbi:TDP-N-acetylfucosamine:lipid II N-acetylfucosaminyltransferase [Gynurincola endophyticus]|uniref:TDP-N-acetylfucosamine:lipid II N-acetylfucosaminyltransferase n=1 Tax=Gynurincola endophyticus TaxID=2479004 RepID=UPI000F8CECEF|nr:TDP-N-acetylfucosamine:lipid II N-acetylfucosaminyltransferase [Gynurincola endophyticus]
MSKVLHLMIDEKFIDFFIEQSEQIAPDQSVYWIASNKPEVDLKYVKSKKVVIKHWSLDRMPRLIEEANQYKMVFFHSFFFDHLDHFLLKLSNHVKIAWTFWGGDGYKYDPDYNKLLLPETKKLINTDKSLVQRLKGLVSARMLWYNRYVDSQKVINYFKRLDYCLTWVKGDYDLIKKFNPRMKWLTYNYFTTEQIGIGSPQESGMPDNTNIWLGNSATATNNHADALLYLKEINWSGDIYCPLSYGDDRYKELVIKLGKKLFSEQFKPIVDFLPLSEYKKLMSRCTVVWMNHIRQQAAGNILQAVLLGKYVILKKENTLSVTLKEWGVDVFHQESLKDIHALPLDQKKGYDLLNQKMSFEGSLESLKTLYKDVGVG